MSQPYVGEIILVAFNFAPLGWAFCDGSLMPISENEVLFNLIGTTYGGDGQETFRLPDLRGRAPIHMNTSTYFIGQSGGTESTTLTINQIPTHTHVIDLSGLGAVARCRNSAGNQITPVGGVPASRGFSDDPIVAGVTPFKASHVSELRQSIDVYRAGAGLGPYPYSLPPPTAGTSLMAAQYVLEMRTAVTQAYDTALVPPPSFDPNLAVGQPIKALHLNELRTAIAGPPRSLGGPPDGTMAAGAVTVGGTAVASAIGGNQPHENMQPSLVLNYCISLFGVFPTQS